MKEAIISCLGCETKWEDSVPGWVECPDCQYEFEVDDDGFWLSDDYEDDDEDDDEDEDSSQVELPHSSSLSYTKNNPLPEFAPLLEISLSTIYSTNAFRLLMLGVEASEREISRQVRQLKLQERFSAGESRGFPFEPFPTLDEMRLAQQRLSDPERRLIDELFWFWPVKPGQSTNDEALLALSNNKAELAAKLWINNEKTENEDHAATHNLAILSHMIALSEELHSTPTGSNNEQKQMPFPWREVFKRWLALWRNEPFWLRLSRRIQDLDEPALTSVTAQQIRDWLPVALLSINAQLAIKAAEGGDMAGAKRQLQIMRESGFEPDVIEETLRRAILPLRERLKLFCRKAIDEAESNPAQVNEIIGHLFEQTTPLLDIMNLVLATGNALREGLHDEVAFTARSCLMKFFNEAGNYNVFIELLETARSIAIGNALLSRLEDDLEIARDKLESQENHSYLDWVLEQLDLVLDSGLSPQAKLQKARNGLLSSLLDLKKRKLRDPDIVVLTSNIVARLLHEIAVELHNTTEDYELAYEAMLTASHLCLDEEGSEMISKDLLVIQRRFEADRQQKEEKKTAEAEAKRLAHEYELRKDLQALSIIPDVNAVFGIGTGFYGISDYDDATKSYLSTLYLILFFIPILPIARYRIVSRGGNAYIFWGKAELRPFERQHRAIVAPLYEYWYAVFGLLAVASMIYVSTTSTAQQTQFTVTPAPSVVQPSANLSDNRNQTAKSADNQANINKSPWQRLSPSPAMQPLPELTDRKIQPVPATPLADIPPAQIDASREEANRLIREIEAAKLELSQMEKEIDGIKRDLATCKSKIDYYAGIIKRIERDDASGLRIDRTEYESAIKEHNEYVDLHNTILRNLREKETTYDDLLETTNTNIRRYNRLIGAQ
jgi:hypothetical protein